MIQSSKVQMPGVCPGGGGGMLKFRVDRRITRSLFRADMRLIPLELQPTIDASRRKAREAFLIYRGKTLSPEGINRKNER